MITAVFTVAYLAVTAWLCRGLRLNTRSVCYGGLTCAATLVLGSFLLYLPTGAAISPGSWIPLMLLALTYDWRLACVTGWVTGILAIFLIPAWAPVHWAQVFRGAPGCLLRPGLCRDLRQRQEMEGAVRGTAGHPAAVHWPDALRRSLFLLKTPGTAGGPGGTASPTTCPARSPRAPLPR